MVINYATGDAYGSTGGWESRLADSGCPYGGGEAQERTLGTSGAQEHTLGTSLTRATAPMKRHGENPALAPVMMTARNTSAQLAKG